MKPMKPIFFCVLSNNTIEKWNAVTVRCWFDDQVRVLLFFPAVDKSWSQSFNTQTKTDQDPHSLRILFDFMAVYTWFFFSFTLYDVIKYDLNIFSSKIITCLVLISIFTNFVEIYSSHRAITCFGLGLFSAFFWSCKYWFWLRST